MLNLDSDGEPKLSHGTISWTFELLVFKKEHTDLDKVRSFSFVIPLCGDSFQIRYKSSVFIPVLLSGSNLSLSFFTHQGRLRVPQDLCNTDMDDNCPIAMVLPSTTGLGVCTTSLTFFLVNANNESLIAYRSATNQDRFIILQWIAYVFLYSFNLLQKEIVDRSDLTRAM